MTRHYMNHSISQLERIVSAAERGQNSAGLKAVRDELKHRSTQRAKDLLAQIERLMLTLNAGSSTVNAQGSGQLELVGGDSLPLEIPVLVPRPNTLTPAPALYATPVTAAPHKPILRPPLTVLGAQEAAKVLGVPLGARWDVVEAARATLLRTALFSSAQGAQPDEQAARRINGAYISLNASRRY
jgi:hypothetical protein